MHVLLSTTPIPAHTYNAAAFVEALVAGGDTVTWHAPRGYHRFIASLGAEPADVEHAWNPAPDALPRMGTLPQIRRGYAEFVAGGAPGRARDLLALIDRRRPDLVLADTLAFGAGLAAEARGIPWASFGDGPLHDRDPFTPPFGSGLAYRTEGRYRLRNRVVRAVSDGLFAGSATSLREARRALGLPPAQGGALEAGVSARLHLHGGVPALEYPRYHPLPAATHFVGSLYRRPPGVAAPDWCEGLGDDGRPVVAVTQGSLRLGLDELVLPVLAALADVDATIVVAAGSPQGMAQLDHLGRSRATVLAAPHIPYDALLDRATLFVTNGGWTGVTAALARGVPVLQVGATEEKADIGRRIEWSGCGISLRQRRVPPRQLRDAVRALLTDPRTAAATADMHRQFAARDAGADGARLLRRETARDLAARAG